MNKAGMVLFVLLICSSAGVVAQEAAVSAIRAPADCEAAPPPGGSGPLLTDPTLSVTINNLNLAPTVEVGITQPVRVGVTFNANSYPNSDCDVWLVCRRPVPPAWRAWGPVTTGPWAGLTFPGVRFLSFFSGTISTINGSLTIPDPFPNHPGYWSPKYCPQGAYEMYFMLENTSTWNGDLWGASVWKIDQCHFTVIPEYKWDDRTTENLLAWTSGGEMVGMHCFETIPGGENIVNVGTIFGSVFYANYAPGDGTPTDFYVWEATNFGDPQTATLLAQGCGVVGNVDTDIHYWDACPCTITTPFFWVAYNLHHGPGEYCLAIDSDTLYEPGAAFFTGTNGATSFDPVNLYNNQYPPAESPYGFWTVRAQY